MFPIDEISPRVEAIIRSALNLGVDVQLQPNADLVNEVGLDSIEAFESIATLHELLGVRIPEDLDPKSIATVNSIAQYIQIKYSPEVIQRFMEIDIQAELAAIRGVDDFA
jgi:acyl carrier protein